jgi:hypothetical protein
MGHALGLQHEHNHSAAGFAWDEKAVIKSMKKLGWSEKDTRDNILDRYTQAANCVGNPSFDRQSVMIYPIPSSWTHNQFSSTGNVSISQGDYQCVVGLYSI